MGRRRRRRKIRLVPKKRLPKIFQCPRCGNTSVSVMINKKEGKVAVKCSSCGLEAEFKYNPYLAEVDYYSRFLDAYEEGKIGIEEAEVEEENNEPQETGDGEEVHS